MTVQIPKNRLERTVLIRDTVKMTFDCSPIISRILEFSPIVSNITTDWLVQNFELNGTLASMTPVSYSTGYVIYVCVSVCELYDFLSLSPELKYMVIMTSFYIYLIHPSHLGPNMAMLVVTLVKFAMMHKYLLASTL